MKCSRIAMVGYGNVGTALVELLSEIDPKGQKFVFSGVATRKLGTIKLSDSPAPMAAKKIRPILKKSKISRRITGAEDIIDWLESLDYDVLVEVSDANYLDGEPALSYIRTALNRGIDVATANKAPIALALRDLRLIGERTGARLRFESTVMDGTPIFSVFSEAMPPVEILRIRGVLNSTANIVLDFLNRRRTLKEGLAKAKSMGVTESDPDHDLHGFDSAAKLIILANALNDMDLRMDQVLTQPLTEANFNSIKRRIGAKNRSSIIRQVSIADFKNKKFRVGLEVVKKDDMLYTCVGSSNMVLFSLDHYTELVLASRNPTLRDTAFGIYSDLSNLHDSRGSESLRAIQ